MTISESVAQRDSVCLSVCLPCLPACLLACLPACLPVCWFVCCVAVHAFAKQGIQRQAMFDHEVGLHHQGLAHADLCVVRMLDLPSGTPGARCFLEFNVFPLLFLRAYVGGLWNLCLLLTWGAYPFMFRPPFQTTTRISWSLRPVNRSHSGCVLVAMHMSCDVHGIRGSERHSEHDSAHCLFLPRKSSAMARGPGEASLSWLLA